MSNFPLAPGKGRSHGRFSSSGLHGNTIEIEVLEGEVLSHPTFGLFAARGPVRFRATLNPAPGFYATSGFSDRANQEIVLNLKDEPVQKLLIRGWFNDKPKRPYPTDPDTEILPEHSEYVEAWVRTADLDIDSDNNDGPGLSRSDEEDSVEAPSGGSPAKIFAFSPGLDTDSNGVPDFADGINVFGNSGAGKARQWPVIVLFLQGFTDYGLRLAKLRFQYPGSSPAGISREQQPDGTYLYTPATGGLRIWTQDGPRSRNAASVPAGHYIIPGAEYLFSDLNDAKVAQGHWRFFAEPIGNSAGAADQSVELWVDPFGEGEWLRADFIKFTLLPVRFTVMNFDPNAVYAPQAKYEEASLFRAGFAGVNFSQGENDVMVQIGVCSTANIPSLVSYQNIEAKKWIVGWIHVMDSYDLKRTYQSSVRVATTTSPFPLIDCPDGQIPFAMKSSHFLGNGDTVNTFFGDTPFDPDAFWYDPSNGTSNPIQEWHLKTSFTTWLVAHRDGSDDYIYLKYVTWKVESTATIDITKPTGLRVTITSRTAQVLSAGDGRGPNTPKLVGPTTNTAIVRPTY